MLDLSGRVALVTGVANKRSIAWGVAQALDRAGAQLVVTSRRIAEDERARSKLESLVGELDGAILLPCDVQDDAQLEAVFERIEADHGRLDAVVHSVAFAPPEELQRPFTETSREGFRKALEISAYSLIPLARLAQPLMERADGGSIVAMSYLAAERAMPTYNVMGTAKAALEQIVRQLAYELGSANIRVNGISSGAVPTLSARGIPGFTDFLQQYEERAPLQRSVSAAEIGNAAAFLLSELASGITGEILFVDAGYHAMGT